MIQDNIHIPSIYGFIIIVAAAIGGLLIKMPPNKPQKVVAVQAPDISIHDAITAGNIPDVEKQLAAGVDVNAKCLLGVTPLFYATFNENKAITKLLITAGADVNAKTVDGRIPLQNAAFHGNKEIAVLLIAKGANVNAKDDIYGTPLDVAIEENHTETADLLRKYGGKTAEELKAEVK